MNVWSHRGGVATRVATSVAALMTMAGCSVGSEVVGGESGPMPTATTVSEGDQRVSASPLLDPVESTGTGASTPDVGSSIPSPTANDTDGEGGGKSGSDIDAVSSTPSMTSAPTGDARIAASTTSPPPSTTVPMATSTTTMPPAPTTPVTTTAAPEPPASSVGPRVVTLEIPWGTADRLAAGEDVGDVLPSRLTLSVGDTLELVNSDSTFHIYGPVSARAGETVKWLLPQPGEFTGLCTSNTERTVTLTVLP